MENRFKLKIPSMFRTSFGSCRSKHISDVIEPEPDFATQNRKHYQLIELFSPEKPPRPFPSICRPKGHEKYETQHNCIVSKNLFPRTKISDKHSLFVSGDGQKCPPVLPISPRNTSYNLQYFEVNPKERRTRKTMKKKRKKTHLNSKKFVEFDTNDQFRSCKHKGFWFSSDDDNDDIAEEDDKTTLFSSKSLSLLSDSSDSFSRNKARFGDKSVKPSHGRGVKMGSEKGLMPVKGKVKGSFAVVKRSDDPYNDFMSSMMEMIIEKQIFSAKDLENLLQCFLSLNSYHHHGIIVQVFSEILEALFPDWS